MRSRAARLVFAVSVLMVVMLAIPLAASASWDPWMSTRLIAYDGPLDVTPQSRELPAVSGTWVVWQEWLDSSPADADVFAYNMTTGARKDIWTADGAQGGPCISGEWVVLAGNQTGDSEIYACNLATDARKRITTRPGNQDYPDISGSKIVFEDTFEGDIRLYDLASNIETELPLGLGIQETPRISGDRVVYVQSDDIYVFDLRSAVITRLTSAALLDHNPDIDGTLVAWQRESTGGDDILCRDITGSAVKTAAGGTGGQTRPRVDGTRIVYYNANGVGPRVIWIYDAALDLATSLTDSGSDDRSAAMSGNDVVYVSNGDIAWGRLAAPGISAQALAPTVAYGKAATIVGTLVENGRPLGAMPIAIDKSMDRGHTWSAIGTATTGASGSFAYATGANTTLTHYRVRYEGRSLPRLDLAIDHFSAQSSAVAVLPEASLTMPGGPKSKKHNAAFSSSGYLKPLHAAGTKPVIIKCYKKSGKHWNLKKTYNATISNYDSTKCKYKASVKLPSKGSWRIRAYYTPSVTNAPKYSSYRYIKST